MSLIKPAELYWSPGDSRPHDDEEAFADVFRRKVNERFGYSLKDWWELHDWSTSKTAEFLDFVWEYLGIVGERGNGPAFVEGIPMDEPQEYFPGSRINVTENLLLSHKSAMSKTKFAMIATVEPDPKSGNLREPVEIGRITYFDLYHEVRRAAHALRKLGVKPGDSVVTFAATSCEMLIVFMATIAVGAIFSSTPAEFGVKAIVDRYASIKPRILFGIDRYRYGGKEHRVEERLHEVVKQLPSIEQVYIVGHLAKDRKPQPQSLKGFREGVKVNSFQDFIASGADAPLTIDFWRGPFSHPIWIVFSSGTTGKPKAILGPGGGVMLMRKMVMTIHCNVDHRDSYLQFATMGWIVFNLHLMYAATGGTIVAYDGSPFHPTEVLWRLIERERVSLLGVSPRYIQGLAKARFKPAKDHDLSCLKQLYTTGAPVTHDVYDFCKDELNGLFVNNAAGGTELGGSALQSTHVLPTYKGELQTPVLGISLIAAGPKGESLIGEEGLQVFSKPFANMPTHFVDDPDRKRYKETYFSDFTAPPMFNMSDAVIVNPATRGWLVLGRADGVLNPSGVRFGSSDLYLILEREFADDIEDSIAVGQRVDNNERVVLFVKTRGDAPLTPALVTRIKNSVANSLSRRHVPEIIAQCPDVPLTASGKKVEPSVKKLVNGVPLASINVAGVVNPEAYKWYAAWAKKNSPTAAKL